MSEDGGEDRSRTGGRTPDDGVAPDPDRAALLREVAEDLRGPSSEAEQLAALLYRVSDLYDPDEETNPAEIHRNMRTILRITARGTLERE